MKFLYGLSAAMLGTTLLAGGAIAADAKDNPPPHPRFSAQGRAHGNEDIVRTTRNPTGRPQGAAMPNNARTNFNAPNANTNAVVQNNNQSNRGNRGTWGNWQRGQHGNSQPHWNTNNLHDHNVAHFSAQDRSTWQRGHWQHGRHHGRNGWWWNSGGSWFFYNQPVYPYPGYVSDYYYNDDYYDGGDDGYADPGYDASPSDGGYYWYYCNNPAGYYPYVKSCRGPWRAVTPTPDTQQGYAPDDSGDQGPAPGYNGREPAPGDQYDGPDDDDRGGPPPGYTDDRGPPPPGYDNGPDDDDDNGPPR